MYSSHSVSTLNLCEKKCFRSSLEFKQVEFWGKIDTTFSASRVIVIWISTQIIISVFFVDPIASGVAVLTSYSL